VVRWDLALGIAAEFQEVAGLRACVDAARRLFPSLRADALEAGGGIVAFCGANSPLSRAAGVGLREPAGRAEVDAIVRFYRERDTAPVVSVTPATDAEFVRALAGAGFVPTASHNLLIGELAAIPAERDRRIQPAADLEAWARHSGRAFMNGGEPDEAFLRIPLIVANAKGSIALEGRDGDAIAVSGCMDCDGEWAGVFGGATTPEFRGRGWHRALMSDRLARAREAGARYVRGAAAVGSASERTFRACGFVHAYTRTDWRP
jgi:GNAT superfamily N-acetyltransferase